MICCRKKLAMRNERKEKPEPISDDEQNRQSCTQRLRGLCKSVRIGKYRWNEHCDSCNKQQTGLEPRSVAVVGLYMVGQAAHQKRSAKHEQRVRNDCARYRGLDKHVLT